MISSKIYPLTNRENFLIKMLNWVNRFDIFSFTHNCGYSSPLGFRNFIAVGNVATLPDNFDEVKALLNSNPGWWFAHFNFEFGERVSSESADLTGFPRSVLFQPVHLLELVEDGVIIHLSNLSDDALLQQIEEAETQPTEINTGDIENVISKETYISSLEKILQHIQRGDCYEMNYCQAFTAEIQAHPVQLFLNLIQASPNPFAAFYRYKNNYCICASPERFLMKTGSHLLSQPIKGTTPRGKTPEEDKAFYEMLRNSEKDKKENVMVVDLVRNDLNRVCVAGSVKVPALFAVKSFPGVHQMESTIVGNLREDKDAVDALAATFPMGSMTGAPKHRVLQITREFESQQRGLFSGTIGYFTPDRDFDFNVVIRSIFYDIDKSKVAFLAGGGITHKSIPEKEYEESLLKTRAIRKVLTQ